MSRALTAVVLVNPWERCVVHVPEINAERERLADLGLFERNGSHLRYTPKGHLAHWIACEMNPKRRSYRTFEEFVKRVDWMRDDTVRKLDDDGRREVVTRGLRDLEYDGLITPDLDYTGRKGQSWRLVF